jgi:hypothetical protein
MCVLIRRILEELGKISLVLSWSLVGFYSQVFYFYQFNMGEDHKVSLFCAYKDNFMTLDLG